MLKVYLDNCCYNRPYDDQEQFRVNLETRAKLRVQELIRKGKLELADSFMLRYENSMNPKWKQRRKIKSFIVTFSRDFIDEDRLPEMMPLIREIMDTGVKYKDSCHIACAIKMHCDYLISTDKRLLKYQSSDIIILNPIDFMRVLENKYDI